MKCSRKLFVITMCIFIMISCGKNKVKNELPSFLYGKLQSDSIFIYSSSIIPTLDTGGDELRKINNISVSSSGVELMKFNEENFGRAYKVSFNPIAKKAYTLKGFDKNSKEIASFEMAFPLTPSYVYESSEVIIGENLYDDFFFLRIKLKIESNYKFVGQRTSFLNYENPHNEILFYVKTACSSDSEFFFDNYQFISKVCTNEKELLIETSQLSINRSSDVDFFDGKKIIIELCFIDEEAIDWIKKLDNQNYYKGEESFLFSDLLFYQPTILPQYSSDAFGIFLGVNCQEIIVEL